MEQPRSAPDPGVFSNPDAAYVLAFAVIMLNTDAHNPMMDTHMTRDDFIAMATSTEVGRVGASRLYPRFLPVSELERHVWLRNSL